jgi:hypothetical protein
MIVGLSNRRLLQRDGTGSHSDVLEVALISRYNHIVFVDMLKMEIIYEDMKSLQLFKAALALGYRRQV